ncbi:hypothetical protein ACLOJK_016784 [Asimina triloba]
MCVYAVKSEVYREREIASRSCAVELIGGRDRSRGSILDSKLLLYVDGIWLNDLDQSWVAVGLDSEDLLIERLELVSSLSVRPGLTWCGLLKLGEQIGDVPVLLVVIGIRGKIRSGEAGGRATGRLWDFLLKNRVAIRGCGCRLVSSSEKQSVAVLGWLGVEAARREAEAAFSGVFRSSKGRSGVVNSDSASETGRESFDRRSDGRVVMCMEAALRGCLWKVTHGG